MTDKEKLTKVIAEIKRLYNQSLEDKNRQAARGLESAASASYGKSIACKELLSFIDSMPKRQVYILKGEIKDVPIADTGDYEVFLDYCRDEYENILDKICDYVNEKYSNDIDRYKVTVQITIDKEE